MAVGHISTSVDELATDTRTVANLFLARDYLYTGTEPLYELGGALFGSGALVVGAPHSSAAAGVLTHDFTDDWYYRVHVLPSAIDFGNLQSTQIEEFIVWNAFFDARALTFADITVAPGLTLDVPDAAAILPYDIAPLDVLTFGVE